MFNIFGLTINLDRNYARKELYGLPSDSWAAKMFNVIHNNWLRVMVQYIHQKSNVIYEVDTTLDNKKIFSPAHENKNDDDADLIEMISEDLFDKNIWQAHNDWVNYITTLTKENEELLSCSRDGTIKIWKQTGGKYQKDSPEIFNYNVVQEKQMYDYNNPDEYEDEPDMKKKKSKPLSNVVKAIPLSGDRIAACSWDHTIKIFDIKTKNIIGTIGDEEKDEDEEKKECENEEKVLSEEELKLKKEFHRGIVNSIMRLEDTEVLVSSSDDMTVKFWNVEKCPQISHILTLDGYLNTNKDSILQFKKKFLLLTNCLKKELLIFNVEGNQNNLKVTQAGSIDMDNLNFNIHSIICTNDSKNIFCSGDGGILCKVDFEKKRLVNVKWDSHISFVTSICQVNDEIKLICSGDASGIIKFWNY